MLQTRKQFLQSALGFGAGILGLTVLSACGGGGGGGNPGTDATGTPQTPMPNCLLHGTNVQIATNHGHVLVVSKEDVAAGTDKSYNIQGTADHMHTVAITAAMFGQLAQNRAIMLESTFNVSATFGNHDHVVMVACV